MTQQLTFVILSTGLETFRELRGALSTQEGARLLVGGDDTEQIFPEIERLRPSAVIVALGSQPDAELRLVRPVGHDRAVRSRAREREGLHSRTQLRREEREAENVRDQRERDG